MLLQPATSPLTAAKVGLFGPLASGKTLNAIMIALGLSKTYHHGAPIAFYDTEDGSPFVQELCDMEGVPLLSVQSRSFIDMRDSLTEAEDAGCCAFIADSYTHPWKELGEALKTRLGIVGRRLQFQHREELDQLWGEWTAMMLASPLHCILAGRLGYEWEEGEDEAGDPTLTKIGTKMHGERNAGYEPHLLIELEAVQNKAAREKVTKRKNGTTAHHLYVLKDRTRALNGLAFKFPDMNAYKVGGYKPVFESLLPHFSKLAIGQPARAKSPARSSAELFAAPSGESAFSERAKRVTIAIEELQGTLSAIWPGSTNDEKRLKNIVLETLFQSRSWTKIETMTPEALESAVAAMRLFEADSKSPENDISSEAAVIALIAACRHDIQTERENVGIL